MWERQVGHINQNNTFCIGKYNFLWWSLWGLDSISGVCIGTAINSSILLLTNSEKDRPIGHLPYRPTGASSCKNCPFGLINCGQRWPWPWAHDFSCFTFRFSFLFFWAIILQSCLYDVNVRYPNNAVLSHPGLLADLIIFFNNNEFLPTSAPGPGSCKCAMAMAPGSPKSHFCAILGSIRSVSNLKATSVWMS